LIFRINKCEYYLPKHYTCYLCDSYAVFFVAGRN
jgi:hypothetical protein